MSFLSRIFSKKKEPEDLPPEFEQSEPPDWLLILEVCLDGLPLSVRVQLYQGSRTGNADILIFSFQQGKEPQSVSIPLLKPEIDRLFIILGFSFPHDIEDVSSEIVDGLPVTLTIHRQQPYAMKAVECNLSDWEESKRTRPPCADISLLMFEIYKRSSP